MNKTEGNLQSLPHSDVIAFANAMGYNYEYKGDGKWQWKDLGDSPLVDVGLYTTEELFEKWLDQRNK